jgi:putative ABC transport system permease protein
MTTLTRKAWADLTRHRGRTLLAASTLCIAIATLGFLAVPGLLGTAMNRQVAASHLNDVGISTTVLDLTPAQLGALGRLPGVVAVSPVLGYTTTATSAAGTQNVEIAGGDLASAAVNTVPLMSGQLPGSGEVLADAANARATDYATPNGSTIDMRAASGAKVRLRVSGTGLNLAATPGANGSSTPVFYANLATVESLRGVRGYNYLGFQVADDTTAGQNKVIAEVRSYLTRLTGTDPFTSLPATRAAGTYPGQSTFGTTTKFLYIITVLAFVSALFLISSTMNTLIAEQASEIAILKTLGARRRQIAGITLRTAAMLGAAGAIPGTLLGILIAYALANDFAVKYIDVAFSFGISVPVVVASLVIGPVLAVAASLPALRRALRRPVAETLAGAATAGYGSGWLDRMAAHSGLMSRAHLPGSLRMGVRNALRSKRRSAATIAQVAVAAGLAISLIAFGQSIYSVINQTIGKLNFSFGAGESAAQGARPYTSHAVAVVAATPGVTAVRPVEQSAVQFGSQYYAADGLDSHPLYSYDLSSGHWFTAAQTAASAADVAVPPVVLGPAVAAITDARVGQTLTFTLAQGPTRVRVIGIDTVDINSGQTVYFPLPVLERLDGNPGASNTLWVSTASTSHAAIDSVATAVGNRLDAAGFPTSTKAIYVIQQQTTAT